jgi:hypothetical protein
MKARAIDLRPRASDRRPARYSAATKMYSSSISWSTSLASPARRQDLCQGIAQGHAGFPEPALASKRT